MSSKNENKLEKLFNDIKIKEIKSENNFINVSPIELGQSRFFYIDDLKNNKKLELISFNYLPNNYGIILVPKKKWPFIYTIYEEIINFKYSYYKGDYCESIKILISNIRETIEFLKDQLDSKEKISFNMIVFGDKVSMQVINYFIDMLNELKEISFDIKIREIGKFDFSKTKKINVKYNINQSPHSLFVFGPDINNNIKSKIIYL